MKKVETERKIEIDSQKRTKFWLLRMREKQNNKLFNYVRLLEKYAYLSRKIQGPLLAGYKFINFFNDRFFQRYLVLDILTNPVRVTLMKKVETERKIEIDSQKRTKFWLLRMREKQNNKLFNYVRLLEKYAYLSRKIQGPLLAGYKFINFFNDRFFQRYLVLDILTNPVRVTLMKKVTFWGKIHCQFRCLYILLFEG